VPEQAPAPAEPQGPRQVTDKVRAELEKAWEDHEAKRAQDRRFLYADVEELLNFGFLSHAIRLEDTTLSLRSLSPGDVFLLRHRVGKLSMDRMWRTWTVAASVWMVEGRNILGEPNAVEQVFDTLQGLPSTTLDVLFSLVVGMFNRLGKSIRRTEAYCYESYSRMGWGLCGRQSPARDDFTGVPGSAHLGMNHVQRMWVAFNIAEDERQQRLHEWQAAKLVASAMSPKGVKKLNRSDEMLRKKEEQRRREAVERMVNEVLLGDTDEAGEMIVMVRGKPVSVRRVKTARTVEDLAEQMRMWVAGEKDWHDLVVDTYKKRVRDHFEEERRERDARLAQVQRQPLGATGATNLVGYTPDQMREFRPELFGAQEGASRIFDRQTPQDLYRKFLAQDAAPGRLHADDVAVGEQEVGEDDLQGAVASRNPAFSTGPMGTPSVEPGSEG
jgi:hypothetical protein